MKNIFQFRHISKYDGNSKILNNISFTIKEKKSVGFIIEDDKTREVFTNLVAGMDSPDAGKILINNDDAYFDGYPYEGIGFMLNEPSFMNSHDGFSNLKMLSEYSESYENDRISKMMSFVGLDPLSEVKVCNYSSAMFKKLCLAYALIPNNELIVLLKTYKNLRYKKTIIYISPTHTNLGQLCDTIFLIENGQLLKVI